MITRYDKNHAIIEKGTFSITCLLLGHNGDFYRGSLTSVMTVFICHRCGLKKDIGLS